MAGSAVRASVTMGRPRVDECDGVVVIVGDDYRLRIGDLRWTPAAMLSDAAGERWMQLAVVCGVDTTTAADETARIDPFVLEHAVDDRPDAVAVTVPQSSSAWASKVVRFVCTPRTVEVSVTVQGSGDITDLTMLGGFATLDNGACGVVRSSIDVRTLLVPAPTEPVAFARPASVGAVLGVLGDADPGRLHSIFSPPPLVFGLGRQPIGADGGPPDGAWLGMSVRERIDRLTCTAVAYEPLDGGFLLRAGYEGHTSVDGAWTSPVVVLRTASAAWDVVDDHRDDLVAHGFAAATDCHRPAAWWSEPLFCGWGAQCAVAKAAPDGTPPADLARQDRYDQWMRTLADSGVVPGTIVIDDRWQAQYGTALPATDRWPDLRGWIRERHAAGQRVLLWWKAWDVGGLPVEECIVDALGRPVAADPANPAYLARLSRIVQLLLSPDGFDADGFKVDFTQRAPSGRSLRGVPGTWGIAALHTLLHTLRTAAKAAKSDALVVTHTVHPSFGDVADMIRMNDVLERNLEGRLVPVVDQLRTRVDIARRALPHHLIDTDQWRMPDLEQWRAYVDAQPMLGVPALYYVDRIDTSGEAIPADDLRRVAGTWAVYRKQRDRAGG